MFRETASGARGNRKELAYVIKALGDGDALLAARLDRLARSTRDLLDTLDTIVKAEAGFAPWPTYGRTPRPARQIDVDDTWRTC